MQRAVAKPWTKGSSSYPPNHFPIPRISLALKSFDPFVEKKLCRLFFCQLYAWFIYSGMSNTKGIQHCQNYKMTFINLPYCRARIFFSNNARSKRAIILSMWSLQIHMASLCCQACEFLEMQLPVV